MAATNAFWQLREQPNALRGPQHIVPSFNTARYVRSQEQPQNWDRVMRAAVAERWRPAPALEAEVRRRRPQAVEHRSP